MVMKRIHDEGPQPEDSTAVQDDCMGHSERSIQPTHLKRMPIAHE